MIVFNFTFQNHPLPFKTKFIRFILLSTLSSLIIGCNSKTEKHITIATAANLQYTIKELVSTFEKETSINCKIVLGSSGKLTAQIEAGAPFDIFLSANTKYPNYLHSINDKYPESITYAHAKLGLFSAKKRFNNLSNWLSSPGIEKIAIPNPKIAPYGKMVVECLKKLQCYQKVKHKLVFGENVMQSNQFVISGAADVGFTALAALYSENTEIQKMHWELIPENLYSSEPQQLLIINSNKDSKLFADFMVSKKAQHILKKYGYGSIN